MIPPELKRLTLCFRDARVEVAFQQHDQLRLLQQGRMALLVAISTYLAHGLLFDPRFFSGNDLTAVWTIRGAATLVPVSVLLFSTHRLFPLCNYLLLALVGLAGGLGLVSMGLYLPHEQADAFYPALILVTFFTYNLVGTRFIYALAVDLLLLAAYNLGAFWRNDIPAEMLCLHDFYIVTANLIGGAAGYLTELQRRQLYLSEQRLRREIQQTDNARLHADAANHAKSRFLASVSHDLRQPIHAQGMFLSVLRNTPLSPKQQELIDHLTTATNASSEMLHTLMDFSRIEAGNITPQFSRFRLQPLLNKIENEFIAQADAKRLNYRSRETDLAVLSDPGLLEVILRNLVGNAIRYTRRGGVLLACRKRGQMALIEVYDTGIGIPQEQHQEIFREFHQLGNPERDRQKGLGLGLAIVKGLATCLQHPISVSSRPGRGSVFRLGVPLTYAGEPLPPTPPVPRILPQNVNILLIDDDDIVRASTAAQLAEWDFNCQSVDDIERALMIARKNPPDLIISDYRLREYRTGAEAIERIRQQAERPIPALLITGDTDPQRLREARAFGVPLLHKPVEPRELYRQIVSLLAQRW
ncbi:hybrid sensor histidine kinase/response regulator [Dechloromonas sp. ZY10]|uniref:ATP-binding response regulator n=1 Tax=Dechloromonas aquae TaxID=2664436 RepID=UPI003528AD10